MPLRLRRASSLTVNPPVVKKQAMDTDQKEVLPHENEYKFENPSHANSLLGCFNELRQTGLFTDVILSADGREFPCHRAVLVAGTLLN